MLRCGIMLAMLLGVGHRAWAEKEKLAGYDFRFAPGMLILGGVLYAAGLGTCAAFWRMAMRETDRDPAWIPTLAAYYAGHLGKYIPGKGLVLVIRAGMVRSSGVSVTAAAVTCVHETVLMMATGAAVAFAILLVVPAPHHGWLLVSSGVLAVGLGAVVFPPVVYRAGQLMSRALPLSYEGVRPCRWRTVALGAGMIAGGWVLIGLSLVAVLAGTHDPSKAVENWALLTAVVALATVGGFVSLTPGGLGSREWILSEVLGQVIGPAGALVAAATLRIVWLSAEVVAAGVFWVLLRSIGR